MKINSDLKSAKRDECIPYVGIIQIRLAGQGNILLSDGFAASPCENQYNRKRKNIQGKKSPLTLALCAFLLPLTAFSKVIAISVCMNGQ